MMKFILVCITGLIIGIAVIRLGIVAVLLVVATWLAGLIWTIFRS